MTYLLDVNVLICVDRSAHVHHDAAHAWFESRGRHSWATCPLTENGVLRVLGHPKYPNSTGNPGEVFPLIARLRSLPGHIFWPDSVSLLDSKRIDPRRLVTPGHVTDIYLLALAKSNDGQLATLDRRLLTDEVPNGQRYLHILF